MLSAILPLPEDMDELSCAGYVRGAPTRFVKGKSIALEVPANAEFILEGTVPPDVRRLEGPFGDHYGHYSEAEMFPGLVPVALAVYAVVRLRRRRPSLEPASSMGPHHDKIRLLSFD